MIESKPNIKILDLKGSFSDIGHGHGEDCRNEIKYLLAERLGIMFSEAPNLSPSRLEEVCQSIWVYIAEHYKDLTEELTATAEGAQIHPWQLILAGAYTDLLDVVRERPIATYDECTLGVSTKPRFIAGTWDSHRSAVNGLVLLRRRPDVGPETLALTTAGWPAQQGINSEGLAFAITNLTPRTARATGLPYIAAVAALAALSTPDEFVSIAKAHQFCSGHSYVVLGSHGPAVIVETTGTVVDISTVTSFDTKANHYRKDSQIDDNAAYGNFANSCKREKELHTLLQKVTGPAEFSLALSKSSSINRVGENEVAVTCAYFYLDPTRQELWYQCGPARDEKMSVVTL